MIGGGAWEEARCLEVGIGIGLDTEVCVEVAVSVCLASSIARTHS